MSSLDSPTASLAPACRCGCACGGRAAGDALSELAELPPGWLWESAVPPSPDEEAMAAAVEEALLFGDPADPDCATGWAELDGLLGGTVWERDEAELALLLADPPDWMSAPAGPALAAALDGLRLGSASPVVLVEALKAGARLRGWTEAFVAAAIAALWRSRQVDAARMLAERDDRYESPGGGGPDAMAGAAAEVAAALRLSPRTVHGHIEDAVRLTRDLPDTFRAVRSGRLSMSQARVILAATEDLPVPAQQAVEQRVLPNSGDQTQAQLKAACRRAVARVDKHAVEARHARAVRERGVTKHVLPDGMAALWFVHTADVVETAWIAINALAETAKASSAQADTANASSALADTAKAGTAQTDAGVPVRDGRTADQRRADVIGDVFKAFLADGVDHCDRPLRAQQRRRPHIEVLVPATTLLGVRDDLAELAGYGPIPASMARRIAGEGTWRRLLTDPATGTVLEAATRRHDPPAQVSETVIARDQTCRWYGCRMPARRCDRDHGVKHKHSGETKLCDLCCLCEYHHAIKDDDTSGWSMVQLAGGVIEWTSPTGHVYRTHPPAVGPIAADAPSDTGDGTTAAKTIESSDVTGVGPPPDNDPPPF